MVHVILKSYQSPGDVLMLTAAVRDMHEQSSRRVKVDVRTSCRALWEHNPHIVPLVQAETGVETIQCKYPLIHRSNTSPWHFIDGFHRVLSEPRGVDIRPT